MKKYLYILSLVLFTSFSVFAQDEDASDEQAGKIREKLTEYVQKRLSLSKSEAERFTPVFIRYFNDLRRTSQLNRNDLILRQQKVAELRLKYRDEFKPILGETRANRVFLAEREFRVKAAELLNERRERLQNRRDNNLRQ